MSVLSKFFSVKSECPNPECGIVVAREGEPPQSNVAGLRSRVALLAVYERLQMVTGQSYIPLDARFIPPAHWVMMLEDGAGFKYQRDRRTWYYFPTDVLVLTEPIFNPTSL